MTMREIGTLVTNAFAEERRKMSALVEEAVVRVRGGPRSGVMPTFEIHLRGTPSGKHVIGESEPSVISRVATSAGATSAVTASSHAPVGVSVPAEPTRPWWLSRHVVVGAGAAAALLVLLLVFVVTSFQDMPAHPDEARPRRVPAATVIRKADMADESLHDVGTDTGPDHRAAPPRVVYVPASSPPAHASKHDHVAGGPPPPPPPNETPASTAPPTPPRTDVPPTGGHAPLRPIVTSNPYGGS